MRKSLGMIGRRGKEEWAYTTVRSSISSITEVLDCSGH